MLEVSSARHCNAKVLFGAGNQNLNKLGDLVLDDVSLVQQVGANQGGDLVVAASASTNLASELDTSDFD